MKECIVDMKILSGYSESTRKSLPKFQPAMHLHYFQLS